MARPALRSMWFASIALVAVIVLKPASSDLRAGAGQIPSSADRVASMRHHFTEVRLVHEAIARGNLAAMRTAAEQLARMPVPNGLPPAATPFVDALRRDAGNAAGAKTPAEAAAATASMLLQCGACHLTLGVRPSVPAARRPDVGGVVGHMLDHQQGMDDLLEGLVVPSATTWRLGAERLRDAKMLDAGNLPSDPKLTKALRLAEQRVHTIARGAVGDETPEQRANHYMSLVTTCAECHGLHSQVWGPTSGR